MKVIAKAVGFYGGARRRAGEEFEMYPDGRVDRRDPRQTCAPMKRNAQGDVVLPKWVVPADDDGRQVVARAKRLEERKTLEGAKAAAGNPNAVREPGHKPGASDIV